MRIEVCGGIASGKTTLTELIRDGGYEVCRERFDENPFYEKFYADPQSFAFEAELVYFLQHFSQIREGITRCPRFAVDFSLALDLAYARVTLDRADQRIFEQVLERAIEKVGPPNLLIRLRCASNVEVLRIRERGRSAEQRIEPAFLEDLELQIERALLSRWFAAVPVIPIDSDALDFRVGGPDRDRVLRLLTAEIANRR